MRKSRILALLFLVSCTSRPSPGPNLPVKITDLDGVRFEKSETGWRSETGEEAVILSIEQIPDGGKARARRDQKLFLIQNLFQEEKSPYPGMTSHIVKCPEKFLPKITKTEDTEKEMLRIQLYATSRRTFGVCTEGEAEYKSVYLLVYCKKSKAAVEVEAFAKKSSPRAWDLWLSGADCL